MSLGLNHWFDRPPLEPPVVCAEGLCKAFGRVPVLFPVSFSLPPGEGLALLGPNGSGKTTLLRLLAGVARPSAGTLNIGTTIRPGSVRSVSGFLSHDSYLYEDLTGYENLRLFSSFAGMAAADVAIAEALEAVGMNRAASDRVRTFSAGMKRRLGLARLLLAQPDVLLMDEPHASLDDDGQALLDSVIQSALISGRAVIIASHDHQRALDLCDQVLVLDSGHATFYGRTDEWRKRTPMWVVGSNSTQASTVVDSEVSRQAEEST